MGNGAAVSDARLTLPANVVVVGAGAVVPVNTQTILTDKDAEVVAVATDAEATTLTQAHAIDGLNARTLIT